MWLGNHIDNMRYGGGAGDLQLLKGRHSRYSRFEGMRNLAMKDQVGCAMPN